MNKLKTRQNRLFIIILLVLIYFGVWILDFFLKDYILDEYSRGGSSKITMEHFVFPKENVILQPHQLTKFLNNVVNGKEGILSWKSFYVILLMLYIVIAFSIFQKLSK